MAEERTWSDAIPEICDSMDAGAAMEEIEWSTSFRALKAFGVSVAKRARERAEKRIVQLDQGEKYWFEQCEAKEAEIARLKEQLADVQHKWETEAYAHTSVLEQLAEANESVLSVKRTAEIIKAALAEAQAESVKLRTLNDHLLAKVIQPGDVIYRPDGEPRVPKCGDIVLRDNGCRPTRVDWQGERTQVYKRIDVQ